MEKFHTSNFYPVLFYIIPVTWIFSKLFLHVTWISQTSIHFIIGRNYSWENLDRNWNERIKSKMNCGTSVVEISSLLTSLRNHKSIQVQWMNWLPWYKLCGEFVEDFMRQTIFRQIKLKSAGIKSNFQSQHCQVLITKNIIKN